MNDFKPSDIATAFALLTRIPMPIDHSEAGERQQMAVWAYPVVGAALGAIAAIAGNLALGFGAPAGIAAALALGTLALLTGAMHEDGIADCADGLGGGKDKESRLSIMRDSRIGAFGATAVGIVLISRWSGIEALALNGTLFWALIAVGAASRLPMAAAMAMMPQARDEGLSADIGMPEELPVVAAFAITIVICIIAFGFSGIFVMCWALAAALPLVLVARQLIGGITGDVLGGSQQLAEVAALSAAIAALT